MSKSVVIAVTSAFLLIVIGGSYFAYSYFQKSQQAANPAVMDGADSATEPLTAEGVITTSLRDLMAMTINQVCTFQDEADNGGAVYSGGGKVRADFTGTTNGATSNTHMISDGTTIYLWFDGAEDGFQMSLTEMEQFQATNPAGTTQTSSSVDVNERVDYDCRPWTVDNSQFTLPNIKFEDFGAMMQTGLSSEASASGQLSPTDASAAQCAACNNLPAEAATQCKLALGCE